MCVCCVSVCIKVMPRSCSSQGQCENILSNFYSFHPCFTYTCSFYASVLCWRRINSRCVWLVLHHIVRHYTSLCCTLQSHHTFPIVPFPLCFLEYEQILHLIWACSKRFVSREQDQSPLCSTSVPLGDGLQVWLVEFWSVAVCVIFSGSSRRKTPWERNINFGRNQTLGGSTKRHAGPGAQVVCDLCRMRCSILFLIFIHLLLRNKHTGS